MDESQAVRPEDMFDSIMVILDQAFVAGQWLELCDGCKGKMAHGRLYRIPVWHCQECHQARCGEDGLCRSNYAATDTRG